MSARMRRLVSKFSQWTEVLGFNFCMCILVDRNCALVIKCTHGNNYLTLLFSSWIVWYRTDKARRASTEWSPPEVGGIIQPSKRVE